MAPKKYKPKKNQANKGPYYFFMMEYKKKQEANGYIFRGGVHEIQQKASPYWNNMTPEEKEPYNKMANHHKQWCRDNGEKYTSQGISLKMVEEEKKSAVQREETMKGTVRSMLDTAVANNELEKLEFYFISFAYFCVTSNGTYIPAEMGLVRFSLKDGVKDKLHMLIDPGKLPLGMAYDAKMHSEGDHQLPIPPDALGEKDNDEIILKLFSFLSAQEKMPPLFTETTEVKMVENILKGILHQGALDEHTLHVYKLSELFFQLKQATENFGMDVKIFPSVHIAQAIIQKDVYEYTKDISCDFHEREGNGKYCPLSKCVRWAYIISDSCCLDLSIEMKPGKHLPLNANTALNTTSDMGDSSFVSMMDDRSYVSSSEITHLTNPKMQKLPKSHYDSFDDRGSTVFSHSRGLGKSSVSGYDTDRKIKEETSSIDDSMKYESSSNSSSRRDPRNPWGSSSSSARRDSPPRRDLYDSSDRYDRGGARDQESQRARRHDSKDRYREKASRSSADYSVRVKREQRSSESDDEDMRSVSRSGDSQRTVGGYGRGSLSATYAAPRAGFSANEFPELGAVRSAGRGQLRK